ncbi:MAG: cupin domain-containing protein [Candidatus Hodarchaeales archaeon]|jgi:quercetin dioxygenase-like cupin family protein
MKSKKSNYFINPDDCPTIDQMEGLRTTILTGLQGEKMMMALNATLPGHTVPIHTHPHEQIRVVYSGKARLKIGDEERNVQKGEFFYIPGNTPHGDTCLGNEPFIMLDIFYPIREDFISKRDEEKKNCELDLFERVMWY